MCRATVWKVGVAVGFVLATAHTCWGQSTYARPGAPAPRIASTAGGMTGSTYAPNTSYYGAGGGAALQPQPAVTASVGGAPCVQSGEVGSGYVTMGGFYGCHGDRCRLFDNHGDMPQHYPYYPPMHGYYYFHPYHHTHVDHQRNFAAQWGMDPRNPYANDIFKVVYAEVRATYDESPESIPVPSTAPAKRRPPMPVVR